MRTGDANVISHLVYALRDLTTLLRIRFDAKGLEIQQTVSNEEVLISCTLRGDKCRSYTSQGTGKIALVPDHLYKIISQATQRDEIIFEYNEKNAPTFLYITLNKDNNDTLGIDQVSEFQLRLLVDTEEFFELEAVPKCFDYVIAFNSTLLHNAFLNLTNLSGSTNSVGSNVIQLSCTKEKIELSCAVDDIISLSRFGFLLSSKKIEEGGKNVEDVTETLNEIIPTQKKRVDLLLSTRHIGQLLKTFNISKTTIILYISEKYPVVFENRIGILGTLKVTVLPVLECTEV